MPAEALLQRRELGVVGQPFHGDDLGALRLHRQQQARAHRGAVDDHGAGATHAVLAAEMRSGEPQLVAQAVRQGHARLDLDLDFLAVDFKSDGHRWVASVGCRVGKGADHNVGLSTRSGERRAHAAPVRRQKHAWARRAYERPSFW